MSTIRLGPVAWSLEPLLLFGVARLRGGWRLRARLRAPAPRAEAEKPSAAATPAPHSDGGEVRIEAGMLRDLRITTAQVESRQGGEQITLLGELAVDERSYAEVGAPVPARVVRLLAGVGDRVNEGQALLELQSQEVGHARSDYLAAVAKLTLAESSLKRKRELAAERITPLREGTGSGGCGRRRQSRDARRRGGAAGDGARDADGRRLRHHRFAAVSGARPCRRHHHRAHRAARPAARSRHGGHAHRRSLDACG